MRKNTHTHTHPSNAQNRYSFVGVITTYLNIYTIMSSAIFTLLNRKIQPAWNKTGMLYPRAAFHLAAVFPLHSAAEKLELNGRFGMRPKCEETSSIRLEVWGVMGICVLTLHTEREATSKPASPLRKPLQIHEWSNEVVRRRMKNKTVFTFTFGQPRKQAGLLVRAVSILI